MSIKTWVVYLVRCSDGSLYTGITNDVDKRLAAHNAGTGAKYTRSRLPVQLAYVEMAADRAKASSRESQLKRLTKNQKEQLVKGWVNQ